MPRGVTFTVTQAKQVDFLMMYARRELNVTSRDGKGSKGYHKLPGPGERFSYSVTCATCNAARSDLPGAKLAVAFVVEHLGHNTDVEPPVSRDRSQTEIGDAARYGRARIRSFLDSLDSEALQK